MPDEKPDFAENLDRHGGEEGRELERQWYVLCPACGAGPMRSSTVVSHLRSKQCARVHGPEEARLLAREAPREPEPFVSALRQLEDWIEDFERRLAAIPAEDQLARTATRATLDIIREQHRRLLRTGSEQYVPPPGHDDEPK